MANPLRLSPEIISAAKRIGPLHKRSVPKQLEYWAELGMVVERVASMEDLIEVKQNIKKITFTPVPSKNANPNKVFGSLEKKRKSGELAKNVTSASVYYEASLKHPGLVDRVNSATGKRQTGYFRNGEFTRKSA
jgi:hypothetical protein